MQRIEIDGVPVFTAPGPERVTAALVFGVGIRDETFATAGVTHLVEHLAMGTLPKSHLQCNAMVDVDLTVFYATGRPDAVRGFLDAICRAISDLPTERIALEIGVLQAENCAGAHPTVAALLGARYGIRGPGLTVAAQGAGPQYLTADVVRNHARTWFVRDNAVLWWHGALPEDLTLALPSGPRPVRPAPEPRWQQGPFWAQGPVFDGAGLLLEGAPRDPALAVGVKVLEERLGDIARHARGLSYSAGVEFVNTAPDRRDIALYVDAREGQAGEVGRILWEQFWTLSGQGPSAEEIAHVVAGLEEELDADEDDFVRGELAGAAFGEVNEVPFLPARAALDAWRTVTPQKVTAALHAARERAIVVLPEGVRLMTALDAAVQQHFCGIVPQVPDGVVFRPSVLKRTVSRRPRMELIVSDAGLAHRDEDGDLHFVPWADVETVVPNEGDEGFAVVGRNLCLFPVFPELFGRKACEAVRARIPASRWLGQAAHVQPPAAVVPVA